LRIRRPWPPPPERRCRRRANFMACRGSGSRDRPRSWRAGLHMAADQHVHRRREAAKEAGSWERRVDHDRLRPWYTAVTRRGRPSRPGLTAPAPAESSLKDLQVQLSRGCAHISHSSAGLSIQHPRTAVTTRPARLKVPDTMGTRSNLAPG
jgi:hypothetical protein